MFSLDKGYLPLYLKAFRSEEAALKKPGYILDNLRSVLRKFMIEINNVLLTYANLRYRPHFKVIILLKC